MIQLHKRKLNAVFFLLFLGCSLPLRASSQDQDFLRRAIELSVRAGLEYGTGMPFGAVIVKDGKIVSEGMNRVKASNDVTWHAEMEAMRLAGVTLKNFKLEDCTLYASTEPCPMCMAAAYFAGIKKVVYGATVEDAEKYSHFGKHAVYEQFSYKPTGPHAIPLVQMLRSEAVEVWKKWESAKKN